MHESHVTREAVERLKAEVPDLCMWVYAAKGINESSGVPDSTLATIASMRLIVEMLSSEPKESILPSASQHRGWDAALLARGAEVSSTIDQVDAMTARVQQSIGRLNEAARQLDVAKALVETKYSQALSQLEAIAGAAVDGGYEGPGAAKDVVIGIHQELRERLVVDTESDASSEYSALSDDASDRGSDTGGHYTGDHYAGGHSVTSGAEADRALLALFGNIQMPPPGF